MPDRVRLGVLGLGAVAQAVHLPIVEPLGDRFQVAAVADLSAGLADAVGERYRVPAQRPGRAEPFATPEGEVRDSGLTTCHLGCIDTRY